MFLNLRHCQITGRAEAIRIADKSMRLGVEAYSIPTLGGGQQKPLGWPTAEYKI